MLKKTITYKDFNDVEHTEDFLFNLTKAEIIEMELTAVGNSFVEHVKNVIATNNGQMIMDLFKSVIFKSYGIKSDDGKRFIKSEQLARDFSHSAAYDVLYVELVTNAEESAKFINGLVPKELAQTPEQIRAASMANMQGFQKKQEKTTEVVPDLPAAEPVLEGFSDHKTTPEFSTEQLEQMLAARKGDQQ